MFNQSIKNPHNLFDSLYLQTFNQFQNKLSCEMGNQSFLQFSENLFLVSGCIIRAIKFLQIHFYPSIHK